MTKVACKSAVAAFFLASFGSVCAQAGAIIFSTAVDISGPTDVMSSNVVRAYDFGGGSLSINGVSFSDFTGQAADTATNVDSAAPQQVFGTGGQTGDYGSLLSGADFFDLPGGTITLNNLIAGDTYSVQIFDNDSRGDQNPFCCNDRNSTFTGDAGSIGGVTIFGGGPPDGIAYGQYVIGTFTADSDSQTVTIGGMDPQVNGLVLSDNGAATPEPGTFGLLGIASASLVLLRRRRGRS